MKCQGSYPRSRLVSKIKAGLTENEIMRSDELSIKGRTLIVKSKALCMKLLATPMF